MKKAIRLLVVELLTSCSALSMEKALEHHKVSISPQSHILRVLFQKIPGSLSPSSRSRAARKQLGLQCWFLTGFACHYLHQRADGDFKHVGLASPTYLPRH